MMQRGCVGVLCVMCNRLTVWHCAKYGNCKCIPYFVSKRCQILGFVRRWKCYMNVCIDVSSLLIHLEVDLRLGFTLCSELP
jgi:hypothetical protein